MLVTLDIRTGTSAGKKIVVHAGGSASVGRAAQADFVFADDTHMSGVHFVVKCDAHVCTLRDMKSSNGTLLNGHRIVDAALLRNGDTVMAGNTSFVVQTADEKAAPALVASSGNKATPQDRLLSMFRGECQPLYALLDAAAEPSVLKVLFESKEEYESLYQGSQAGHLAHFAPYLVRLTPDSKLLETLVRQGWGKNWGVYLTCDQPLAEVRRHFRHFLLVKMPDGKQVYFRFYDPRVLRVFLPTCTPEQTTEFFGPIQCYLVEDENPGKLMQFVKRGRASEKTAIAIDPNPEI